MDNQTHFYCQSSSSYSIQIYSGPGASPICVGAWKRELNEYADNNFYKIEEFTHSDALGLDRGNVAMIIIPGGDACKMDVMSEVAKKIKLGHRTSSVFFSSCAGALISANSRTSIAGTFRLGEPMFKFNPVPY